MDRWRRETENTSPRKDGKKEKRRKTSPEHREGEELEEPMRTLRPVVRVPLPRVNATGAHGGGKCTGPQGGPVPVLSPPCGFRVVS